MHIESTECVGVAIVVVCLTHILPRILGKHFRNDERVRVSVGDHATHGVGGWDLTIVVHPHNIYGWGPYVWMVRGYCTCLVNQWLV